MPATLYLTYDGLTDPLGQSQILPYLLGLEAKGISFYIISFEKSENFEKHKTTIHGIIKKKNIIWHPLPYHKRPPVVATLWDISNLRRHAKKLVREKNIPVVHCRSYVTSLVGLWLKRKHGLKFIFDMRGFWADERVEGRIWNVENPIFKAIYKYFKRKERQFFQEADTIISLTENAKPVIQKMISQPATRSPQTITGKPNQQIAVIPCCADLSLFNPKKVDQEWLTQINSTLNLDFNFKLLYLGSLGTWYMLDEMLDFFEILAEAIPKSQFVILTQDLAVAQEKLHKHQWTHVPGEKKLLENKVWKYGKKSSKGEIIFTQATRRYVPAFIEYADASIMFIRPSFSKKASSATKMGEVLAMGKAVVTNTGWGDVELFQANIPNFHTVNGFTAAEYQRIVDDLNMQAKSSFETGKFALDYFSLENGVERYHQIYKNLMA